MKRDRVILKKIKNAIIRDNTIIFEGDKKTLFDDSLFFKREFDEVKISEPIIVNSGEQRTQILINQIEKLMFYSKKQNIKPTLRTYGYFTAFSSIRQKSETSDIAVLELIEKSNLLKMAKQGYHIKAIIALDINRICNLGYSMEQCVERCKDLYNNLRELDKYDNVEIVFDTGVTLNSFWIIDSLLKAEALRIDINPNKLNYNSTMFDSNLKSIENSVKEFDELFIELKRKDAWRFQKNLSQSNYAKNEINDRLKQYYFKGDNFI